MGDLGHRADADDIVRHWFGALDQRPIRAGLREWQVHVLGIHLHGSEVWIQIGDGTSNPSLLLHLASDTPVEHAVRALTQLRRSGATSYPLLVAVAGQPESLELTLAEP